jgi:hypothetical protein
MRYDIAGDLLQKRKLERSDEIIPGFNSRARNRTGHHADTRESPPALRRALRFGKLLAWRLAVGSRLDRQQLRISRCDKRSSNLATGQIRRINTGTVPQGYTRPSLASGLPCVRNGATGRARDNVVYSAWYMILHMSSHLKGLISLWWDLVAQGRGGMRNQRHSTFSELGKKTNQTQHTNSPDAVTSRPPAATVIADQ